MVAGEKQRRAWPRHLGQGAIELSEKLCLSSKCEEQSSHLYSYKGMPAELLLSFPILMVLAAVIAGQSHLLLFGHWLFGLNNRFQLSPKGALQALLVPAVSVIINEEISPAPGAAL